MGILELTERFPSRRQGISDKRNRRRRTFFLLTGTIVAFVPNERQGSSTLNTKIGLGSFPLVSCVNGVVIRNSVLGSLARRDVRSRRDILETLLDPVIVCEIESS